MIKMVTKSIEDKIHIDDLRSLEMVSIDRLVNQGSDRLEHREGKNTTVWETVQKPNEQGFIDRHNMYVHLDFFEERIIEEVEKQHPLDLQRIVEHWDFPSYNLVKGINLGGLGGDKRCDYVLNMNKDGFVDSIVIMTERNCPFVLDWVLELVT
ncbi:hypothetical protein OAJ80_00815 [Candidatus Thioglobus sp.]|nr:hypothetical protein [Candidatus Thioglobus sp.]